MRGGGRGWSAVLIPLLLLAGAAAVVGAQPRLEELGSVEAFAGRFDAAEGSTRLILLLSPT